jgi:hypothetical protein
MSDVKKTAPEKKGKTMNDAVSGTEAIRTWDEHKIGPEALAAKLETNLTNGLTQASANSKHA